MQQLYERDIPTHNHSMPQTRISILRIILLLFVVMQSEGFLSVLLGQDVVVGRWLFSGVMFCFVALALFKVLRTKANIVSKIFFFPIVAFALFFLVSANSAFFLFPKPIQDWLPSLYIFTPIFIFYFLYVFGYTDKEVVLGLVVVSILVSTLLLYDSLYNLSILDYYQRVSSFFLQEKRRIVILKNEVIIGFVICMSLLVMGRVKNIYKPLLLGIGVMLFLVQAMIMESRMGFMAMGVAFVALLHLKGLTKRTLRIYIVLLLIVLLVLPAIFDKQIEKLSEMSIHEESGNISVRINTIEYFYDQYLDSAGMGIGMMSPNSVNNVLSSVPFYNIADAGVFSALFQFGPLGLLLWGWFTFRTTSVFHRYYKHFESDGSYAAAAYAFMIGFTISPLPLSFFTQSWCISMGGILLYLAWFYERRLSLMNSP